MSAYFVTQSGAGSHSGLSLANAWSVSEHNAATLSPGDTVSLNGTITNPLVIPNSGSSGFPIVYTFALGAKFSKAHWNQSGSNGNAAIYANGKSYVEVDGGENGIIECTANGTALANQVDCHGVRFDGNQTGTKVYNLTVQNLYVRTPSSADANYICNGIYFYNGNLTNTICHSNVTTEAGTGIQFSMSNGSSGIRIYGNTCSKHGIALNMGTTGASVVVDDVEIFENDLSGDLTWSGNSDIHMNTFHVFATQSGTQITRLKFYRNYCHGNMGEFPTSLAFFEGYIPAVQIFNNRFFHDDFSGGNGDLVLKGADGALVLNNTFTNNTPGSNTAIGTTDWIGTETFIAKNNIFVDYGFAIYDGTTGGSAISTASDYNLVYPDTQSIRYGGATHTYAQWVATGANSHGVTEDPLLDANQVPAANSPALGAGVDLSGYFSTDFNGNERNGLWDIGAYQFGSVAVLNCECVRGLPPWEILTNIYAVLLDLSEDPLLPNEACVAALPPFDRLTSIYQVLRSLSGDESLPTVTCVAGKPPFSRLVDIYCAFRSLATA